MSIAVNRTKIHYFEYILTQLVTWYCEKKCIPNLRVFNQSNDFSKLKVLKLHFFVTAINSRTNSLLDVFNRFYAMPYGHVEGEIYDAINQGSLERFTFAESNVIVKDEFIECLNDSFDINRNVRSEILESVASLRLENDDLVLFTALDLVELSHKWTSWRIIFESARSKDKYSQRIPSEIIQNENKFFSVLR